MLCFLLPVHTLLGLLVNHEDGCSTFIELLVTFYKIHDVTSQKTVLYNHRAAGIANGYGVDDRGVGVRVAVGSRIFSFPRR
jgi:hypothetical protein